MTRHSHLLAGLAALALACAACSGPAEGDAAAMNTPATAVPGDRLLPMEDMIARFQAGLPDVCGFGCDAPTSQGDLMARFVAAVEDSSVAALRSITVNAAEFAYLYFPGSMFARAPYAQPPEVNWLLL